MRERYLITIYIICLVVLVGCATVFDGNGKLRAITIARNIYASECLGCNTVVVNTTDKQTQSLSSIFSGFFNTISNAFTAILPRGLPITPKPDPYNDIN